MQCAQIKQGFSARSGRRRQCGYEEFGACEHICFRGRSFWGLARRYSQLIEQRSPIAVRDLLRFREAPGQAVRLDEVESAASMFERFSTAAMSLGSLSPEAHRALAVAMNRTAGQSNSGEGGEAEENYWRDLPGGDRANFLGSGACMGETGTPAVACRA